LDTGVEVLLITSRGTKRWIIPRGWPIKGLKPPKSAAREAYEEAGVRGRVAGRPLGHYVYEKRTDERGTPFPCEVQVFALLVKRQFKKWPECKQRTVEWFAAPEAAALTDDDDLRHLILQLEHGKSAARRKRKGDHPKK
jgi:8-oxo-dGTP pyrophosphatase MutT (NUDIX family)